MFYVYMSVLQRTPGNARIIETLIYTQQEVETFYEIHKMKVK